MKIDLLNQTMYDFFFSSIGILMGFFQVEFFQLSLETDQEKMRHPNYKFVFWAVFVIQELLLFRFFVSLLYASYYGTHIARGACDNPHPFKRIIENLENFGNTTILFFIWALITINLILFLRQLSSFKHKNDKGGLSNREKNIWISAISTLLFAIILFWHSSALTNNHHFREIPWEIFPVPTCTPTPTPKN